MSKRIFTLRIGAGSRAVEYGLLLSATALLLFAAGYLLLVLREPGAFLLALLFALVLLTCTVGGGRRRCDIAVDEEGISAAAFGRVWKTIPWRTVKLVRVTSLPDFEGGPWAFLAPRPMNVYSLYSSKARWLFWRPEPIQFSQRIQDVRELLDIINDSLAGRDVEIIDERTKGNPVRISRL